MTQGFSEETSNVKIVTIGLDTAKSWFQVHGVDESGQVVLRRKLPAERCFSSLPT
jgi:hypothetical protein